MTYLVKDRKDMFSGERGQYGHFHEIKVHVLMKHVYFAIQICTAILQVFSSHFEIESKKIENFSKSSKEMVKHTYEDCRK